MKYLICFLCIAVVVSVALANYDVSASSDAGISLWDAFWTGYFRHWAYAEVSADIACSGWFTVWAEAGRDRGNRDGGSYSSGTSRFYASEEAEDWWEEYSPDSLYHYAYINSQLDEDWSPK